MPTAKINEMDLVLDEGSSESLLSVLRGALHLDGAKQGCDNGSCGHCLVLVDGQPAKACCLSVPEIAGRKILTIEAIAPDDTHPLRRAWREERVANCGHCQSAQMVAAAHFLASSPCPTRRQIQQAPRHVICRCATNPRITHAILRAAALQSGD